MTDGQTVFIHSGAHRTGTSSFQLCLAQNRTALAAAGLALAYPGRDGAPRGKLRLRLPDPKQPAPKQTQRTETAARHLNGFFREGGAGLILSEENIPGRMFHFYRGQFYPGAATRLQALRAALGARPVELIHVLRPYDELFASAFRKRAEDNAVGPFAELVPGFLAMRDGWPELVAMIADILRPRRMQLRSYASRGSSIALLQALVPGLDGAALREPEQTVNLSASDAALAALQQRYHAGDKLTRPQWRAVIEAHAGDPAPQPFAALPAAAAAQLRARFDADLDRIAAMDGVELLR